MRPESLAKAALWGLLENNNARAGVMADFGEARKRPAIPVWSSLNLRVALREGEAPAESLSSAVVPRKRIV